MSRPALDRRAILHIAELSLLSLSDDEADRLAVDLAKILDYVAELDAVDTSEVNATDLEPRAPAAWREDAIANGLSHDDALKNAPRTADDGFSVPAFVES